MYAASLSEAEFWTRLEQSDRLLLRALAQSGDVQHQTLGQIRQLWQNIDRVQFPDQTLTTVDMTWLSSGLPDSATPTTLGDLEKRVQSLLQYHHLTSSDSKSALEAREKILTEPRYQYGNLATPSASAQQTPIKVALDGGFNPFLLAGLGIAVVVAVLFSLGRGLQIQRASIPLENSETLDDEPDTSSAARLRSQALETQGDYRSAMRYAYLACLLLLDEQGIIHYDRTLTNREHLRQVEHNLYIQSHLKPVVTIFDSVWYGSRPIDDPLFAEFRNHVKALENAADRSPREMPL